MKSTISFFPSFWVKVCPIILVLLGIGLSRTQAQNYKPFNEAIQSVNSALDALKAEKYGSTVSPGITPAAPNKLSSAPANSTLKAFEVSYYTRFLELAKINQAVPATVEALDAETPSHGNQGTRDQTVANARLDLMHLITY